MVVSCVLVAVTWNDPLVEPAVKSPPDVMVPPVAVHVTEALAVNCCVPPGASVTLGGVTVSAGAVTVTVVVAVADPAELVAVSVYVVVDDGVTVVEVPMTVPGAGEMLRLVALITDQESVVVCPEVRVVGLAAKVEMVGGCGAVAPPNLPN